MGSLTTLTTRLTATTHLLPLLIIIMVTGVCTRYICGDIKEICHQMVIPSLMKCTFCRRRQTLRGCIARVTHPKIWKWRNKDKNENTIVRQLYVTEAGGDRSEIEKN